MKSEQLLGSQLVVGQPVVYEGPEVTVAILDSKPPLDALRSGHPGRIRDNTPQHIMVDWVCLEDEPISFWSGFVNEKRFEGDEVGSVKGLLAISNNEYESRAAAIRLPRHRPGTMHCGFTPHHGR